MPADLTSLTARVATCLQDATHLVYPPDAIAEGLRQALAGISAALGVMLNLDGLDGATETSLPENLNSLVVMGAAALVVSGRALRHAEQPLLAPEGLAPSALAWAEAALARFRAACECLRSAGLRGGNPPWPVEGADGSQGSAAWPLDGHDGEVF